MNDYFTVEKYGFDEYIINKSRFIGYCKPVSTADEAVDFVNEIRARHRDATHNVYAYVVRSPEYSRYSDDGEPQGTAGMPTLDVIKKNGLTDCCVVVTRYFGGVLLGAGGLVRAYSHCARLAVEKAKIIKMSLCSVMEIVCDYGFYGKLPSIFQKYGCVEECTEFAENVRIVFRLPEEHEKELCLLVTEESFGKILPQKTGEKYDSVKF